MAIFFPIIPNPCVRFQGFRVEKERVGAQDSRAPGFSGLGFRFGVGLLAGFRAHGCLFRGRDCYL